ncbi:MAG: hypothetical protein ACEQSX_05355 [Baekduiaceae bacterium]
MRDDAQLSRVYGYPYPADDAGAPDRPPVVLPRGCQPVLAFGANASRAVLRAKLGEDGAATVSLAARVHGVDTVYSAHVSPYGAIPATLHPSPGTVLTARLLLVDVGLLARLDATEPNYTRAAFDGEVHVEGLGHVAAHAYGSRHGPLRLDGSPVALAAVPAEGRALPALGQREVHAAVRDLFEPGADLDAFVLAGARDQAVRSARTEHLRRLAGWSSSDGDVTLER